MPSRQERRTHVSGPNITDQNAHVFSSLFSVCGSFEHKIYPKADCRHRVCIGVRERHRHRQVPRGSTAIDASEAAEGLESLQSNRSSTLPGPQSVGQCRNRSRNVTLRGETKKPPALARFATARSAAADHLEASRHAWGWGRAASASVWRAHRRAAFARHSAMRRVASPLRPEGKVRPAINWSRLAKARESVPLAPGTDLALHPDLFYCC